MPCIFILRVHLHVYNDSGLTNSSFLQQKPGAINKLYVLAIPFLPIISP